MAAQSSEELGTGTKTSNPQGPALRPPPISTLVEHIAEQLQEAILSGDIPPESRLVEKDLAERFGVSRWPIREALRRLELVGMVTVRPNRGAVVRTLTVEDILEVYVLRATLGAVAIRQLIGAGLVTDQVAKRLTTLERQARRKSVRAAQDLLVRHDLAFQSAVVDACGMPRVISRFNDLTNEVKLFVVSSGIIYTDVEQILTDHRNLLDAILRQDSERALELWHGRMRTAVNEFLTLIPDAQHLGQMRPWLWELL